jgi:hypothetical protein
LRYLGLDTWQRNLRADSLTYSSALTKAVPGKSCIVYWQACEISDASYKLLVIISQGCATYFGDCLFKNTVEAVIRNGDQGYNPA